MFNYGQQQSPYASAPQYAQGNGNYLISMGLDPTQGQQAAGGTGDGTNINFAYSYPNTPTYNMPTSISTTSSPTYNYGADPNSIMAMLAARGFNAQGNPANAQGQAYQNQSLQNNAPPPPPPPQPTYTTVNNGIGWTGFNVGGGSWNGSTAGGGSWTAPGANVPNSFNTPGYTGPAAGTGYVPISQIGGWR